MDLNQVQQSLEEIYDIETPHRVKDFLLHDYQVAYALVPGSHTGQLAEQLFVDQEGDNLDVALFLDGHILERLARDNPTHTLHSGNLQDFCLALEGVSHFLYLVWNAGFERSITQLELELQAEVDKFVATASLIREQIGSAKLRPLRQALFEKVYYRPHLPNSVRERYEIANRLAARYCQMLDLRFGMILDDPALSRELRRFYRMPKEEKLRYIEGSMA